MSTVFRWYPLGLTRIYLDLFPSDKKPDEAASICAWNAKLSTERSLGLCGMPALCITPPVGFRRPGGRADTPATLDAARSVRSLVAMLSARLEGFAVLLDNPAIY